MVKRTNQFRGKNQLAALSLSEPLTKAASRFATFMAENEKYGHQADGRTPAKRAEAAGYEYCVVRENIAYRTNTGEVTAESLIDVFVQGWIDSPPHRENMLADYVSETGVGIATADGVTYYAVQLFGRPKSATIRIEVTNRGSDVKSIVVAANDSEDEIELPPRATVRMKRCLPTTVRLSSQKDGQRFTESTVLFIEDDDIKVVEQ